MLGLDFYNKVEKLMNKKYMKHYHPNGYFCLDKIEINCIDGEIASENCLITLTIRWGIEGNGETTTYTNKLYSINTDSDGNKPYLIVKVQHKTLGFSAQYKFFIGEEVSKVTTSKATITF